eukprot:1472983-Amphidinium_carterae.1
MTHKKEAHVQSSEEWSASWKLRSQGHGMHLTPLPVYELNLGFPCSELAIIVLVPEERAVAYFRALHLQHMMDEIDVLPLPRNTWHGPRGVVQWELDSECEGSTACSHNRMSASKSFFADLAAHPC